MSNSNSTCGYLIVNMWKIYSSLRHQGSEASILAGRLVDHFEGEENLMSKVMETASTAANAIDTLVDWNDYFSGVFDFEESDRCDSGSIAAELWQRAIVDDQDVNLVIFNCLSGRQIPLKSQECAA